MHYDLVGMKKQQVARKLAKESRMTEGAAADQVDRILSDLRKKVRKGQSASLPGLGTFRSGRKQEFQFDPDSPTVTPTPKPRKESK
jgi:nucleoid DNA-binding protein